MERGPKSEVLCGRFAALERAIVQTAAAADGMPVAVFVHRSVISAAIERVWEILKEQNARGSAER